MVWAFQCGYQYESVIIPTNLYDFFFQVTRPDPPSHRCTKAYEVCLPSASDSCVEVYAMGIQKTRRGAWSGRADRKKSYKQCDLGFLLVRGDVWQYVRIDERNNVVKHRLRGGGAENNANADGNNSNDDITVTASTADTPPGGEFSNLRGRCSSKTVPSRTDGQMLGFTRNGHVRFILSSNRGSASASSRSSSSDSAPSDSTDNSRLTIIPVSFGHPAATDKDRPFFVRIVASGTVEVRELPVVPPLPIPIQSFCLQTLHKQILLEGAHHSDLQHRVFLCEHSGATAFIYLAVKSPPGDEWGGSGGGNTQKRRISSAPPSSSATSISFRICAKVRGMVCRTAQGLVNHEVLAKGEKFQASWRKFEVDFEKETHSRLLMVLVRGGQDWQIGEVSCKRLTCVVPFSGAGNRVGGGEVVQGGGLGLLGGTTNSTTNSTNSHTAAAPPSSKPTTKPPAAKKAAAAKKKNARKATTEPSLLERGLLDSLIQGKDWKPPPREELLAPEPDPMGIFGATTRCYVPEDEWLIERRVSDSKAHTTRGWPSRGGFPAGIGGDDGGGINEGGGAIFDLSMHQEELELERALALSRGEVESDIASVLEASKKEFERERSDRNRLDVEEVLWKEDKAGATSEAVHVGDQSGGDPLSGSDDAVFRMQQQQMLDQFSAGGGGGAGETAAHPSTEHERRALQESLADQKKKRAEYLEFLTAAGIQGPETVASMLRDAGFLPEEEGSSGITSSSAKEDERIAKNERHSCAANARKSADQVTQNSLSPGAISAPSTFGLSVSRSSPCAVDLVAQAFGGGSTASELKERNRIKSDLHTSTNGNTSSAHTISNASAAATKPDEMVISLDDSSSEEDEVSASKLSADLEKPQNKIHTSTNAPIGDTSNNTNTSSISSTNNAGASKDGGLATSRNPATETTGSKSDDLPSTTTTNAEPAKAVPTLVASAKRPRKSIPVVASGCVIDLSDSSDSEAAGATTRPQAPAKRAKVDDRLSPVARKNIAESIVNRSDESTAENRITSEDSKKEASMRSGSETHASSSNRGENLSTVAEEATATAQSNHEEQKPKSLLARLMADAAERRRRNGLNKKPGE